MVGGRRAGKWHGAVGPPSHPVTVVVITRNRRRSLLDALGHLTRLPEQPAVVVVDNGSQDGSADAVRASFPSVVVVGRRENLGAAGRNVGASLANTPYVAFSDDDSWWDPGALDAAARLLDAAPDVGLVAAKVLVGPESRLDPTSRAMATSALPLHPTAGCRTVVGFLACGAVVRRAAFLGVGGFEPELGLGGEEQLLALDLASAGWALVYAPKVVARHHPWIGPDRGDRSRRQAANGLVVAWARLPATVAWRASIRALRSAGTVAAAVGATGDALGRWRWISAHRRVVPPEVIDAVRRA
jgi:GT2 family glycosyltransferase